MITSCLFYGINVGSDRNSVLEEEMSSRSEVGRGVKSSGTKSEFFEVCAYRACIKLVRSRAVCRVVLFILAFSVSLFWESLGFIDLPHAYAQDAGIVATAPDAQGMSSTGGVSYQGNPVNSSVFWTQTLLYVSIGWFLIYLLIVKPKAREEDEKRKFLSRLKKGDEVLVNSSFLGKVIVVKPEVITVELAPDVKVRVIPAALSARNGTEKAEVSLGAVASKAEVKKQ